jgi:hypothetical protein
MVLRSGYGDVALSLIADDQEDQPDSRFCTG